MIDHKDSILNTCPKKPKLKNRIQTEVIEEPTRQEKDLICKLSSYFEDLKYEKCEEISDFE